MTEDIVKGIKTILETYLKAAIDAQDTAQADGLTTRTPSTILAHETKAPDTLPIVVILSSGRINSEGFAMGFKDVIHEIEITYIETDTDFWSLERKVMRAVRAIENVLETHFQEVSKILEVVVDRIIYNQTVIPEENTLIHGGTLSCRCFERLPSYTASQI